MKSAQLSASLPVPPGVGKEEVAFWPWVDRYDRYLDWQIQKVKRLRLITGSMSLSISAWVKIPERRIHVFFLRLTLFLIVYPCMSMCKGECRRPWRPEAGTGVYKGLWAAKHGCSEPNPGPLQVQQVPLIVPWSSSWHPSYCWLWIWESPRPFPKLEARVFPNCVGTPCLWCGCCDIRRQLEGPVGLSFFSSAPGLLLPVLCKFFLF